LHKLLNENNKLKDCSVQNCSNCPVDACDSCIDGYYFSGGSCVGNILQFYDMKYLCKIIILNIKLAH